MRATAERLLCHGFVLLVTFIGAGAFCSMGLMLLITLLFGVGVWVPLSTLCLLLYPAAVLPGMWSCIHLWPDRLPFSPTRDGRRLPVWVRITSDTRLMVAATLAGTALLALFWTELSYSLLLLLILAGGGLLWLLALPWVIVEQRASWHGRLLRIAVLLGTLALLYHSPAVGERFRLWRSEEAMQAEARTALAARVRGKGQFPNVQFIVDQSDDPPVRVVFFWHRSREGWNGVVYDPTGEVSGRDRILIWDQPSRITARHLWGPWYRAFGR